MKKILLAILLLLKISYAEDVSVSTDANASSEYTLIENRCSLKILSPLLQDRQEAKIKLKNGLEIFLISDPKATSSSTSMSVAAGSWNDPKKYPGMAHFVEHMLFKGTEKYPEEEGFIKFITENSGSFNAFTAACQTVYIFSVNNEKFTDALDRFSYFFISPLFNSSCVERELQVVDQEFSQNLENDAYRLYLLFKELSNPEHPHSKFSTGNSETLSKIPLDSLRKWYERHYSANQMRLTVYSNLSIKDLKELVVKKFQSIPDRQIARKEINVPMYSDHLNGKIVFAKPIRNCQNLYLEWELPKEFVSDDSKSAEILASALICGQKNCLKEYLKKEKLIEDLAVYPEKIYPSSALLSAEFKLTDQGLKNYHKVIKIFFEAVENFKKNGIPEYLFDEQMEMAKLLYAYQGEENAFYFAMRHGTSIQEEDLATYPQKHILGEKFDKAKIDQLFSFITYENCHFAILADPQKVGIQLDKKEKWAGMEYAIQDFDRLETDSPISPELAIPKANPYIPKNLMLCEKDSQSTLQSPQKIVSCDKGTLFFAQDDKFQIPKVVYFLNIKTPVLDNSPRSLALKDLYMILLGKRIEPLSTLAGEAGLFFQVNSDLYSIDIMMSGFNEKAPQLLQEVLTELKKPFSKDLFSLYRKSLKRKYKNSLKELPLIQARARLSSIIYNLPTQKEILKTLRHIRYEDFLIFQQKLFERAKIEALFAGNLTKSSALSTWQDTLNSLEFQPVAASETLKKQIYSFPENAGPFIFTENTKAKGSGLILLLDEGLFTYEKRAAQNILAQALSEPFFTALRSKQKTAYIASSNNNEEDKHLFQYFMVQSATHTTEDLLSRFEIFIEDYMNNIDKEIPPARFEEIKNSLYLALTKPTQNLLENSLRQNILAFKYDADFGWNDKCAQALKDLQYEEFLAIARNYLSRENRKRLAIAIKGPLPKERLFSYEKFTPEKIR